MIVDRGGHKRGHGLNRPRRALQARLEPIFDGLIAEHHNVVMGQTPARPTAQSPAERANRPALGRVMAFDLFFLRQVGKNRLRVEWHDEHPIRGFYHEDQRGRAATEIGVSPAKTQRAQSSEIEGEIIRKSLCPSHNLALGGRNSTIFARVAQILNYSNTKDTKEELSRKGSKSVFVMSNVRARPVRAAHFTETFVSFVPSWCTSYT